MSKTSFYEGTLVRCQFEFRNSSGYVDPTSVTCKVQEPQGTEAEYAYGDGTLLRASTGIYYVSINTTGKRGDWRVAAYGTGTNQAAVHKVFKVYSLYDGDQF